MNKYSFFCLILCHLFFIQFLSAQVIEEKQDSVLYSTSFEFKDGIYISVKQFRANKPISSDHIQSFVKKGEEDYYKKLLNKESFKVVTDRGEFVTVYTDKVFGFCEKGVPYINFQGNFYKITKIGQISTFAALVPSRSGIQPGFAVGGGSFGVGGGFGVSIPIGGGNKNGSLFAFNIDTGKGSELTYKTMEELLKDDEFLHGRYSSLKRRQKKKMMLDFLNEYNSLHPLYFPK